MEGGSVGHNFERDLPKDHPCQVWFNLVQGFLRRRFKCERLRCTTDGRRRTPSDGKSSHGLWPGELKTHWMCGNDIIWTKYIDITHLVSFFTFFFIFFYLILWVNIQNVQLNVHFYIFFQITIYSDGSLADEIWWTFYKRTDWASRKNIKYGLRGFFLLLSFEFWIGQL